MPLSEFVCSPEHDAFHTVSSGSDVSGGARRTERVQGAVQDDADPVRRELRRFFDAVAEDPVPDPLADLAARLDVAYASGLLGRRRKPGA